MHLPVYACARTYLFRYGETQLKADFSFDIMGYLNEISLLITLIHKRLKLKAQTLAVTCRLKVTRFTVAMRRYLQ